jgi:TPR repeat protein
MKTVLEKLSRYWQLRFVAVGIGVLLVVYAVLLPDSGADSRNGSIQAVAAAPLMLATSAESPVLTTPAPGPESGIGANGRLAAERPGLWLGINHAVADQLEIPVQSVEESELPLDFSESMHRLRAAANQGDPTAQFLLGHSYESGLGVRKDMSEMVHWYARAAEARPTEGPGKPERDFSHAFESYRAAAERGNIGAQLYLGLAYDLGQDVPRNPAEAARWYRRAAAEGSPSAASNLGVLYHNGDSMPKDSVEAATWFESAAARGSASAQYSLGRMYYQGDGVARNYAEAARWLEKSASQGNASAQILLSYLYATGQGVPGNTAMAYMWINLASASEDLARLSREQMEKLVSFDEVAEGQRLTHDWLIHHPQATQ